MHSGKRRIFGIIRGHQTLVESPPYRRVFLVPCISWKMFYLASSPDIRLCFPEVCQNFFGVQKFRVYKVSFAISPPGECKVFHQGMKQRLVTITGTHRFVSWFALPEGQHLWINPEKTESGFFRKGKMMNFRFGYRSHTRDNEMGNAGLGGLRFNC
jgi:hypothetical protein